MTHNPVRVPYQHVSSPTSVTNIDLNSNIQDDFNFLAYKLGERLTDDEIEVEVLKKIDGAPGTGFGPWIPDQNDDTLLN